MGSTPTRISGTAALGALGVLLLLLVELSACAAPRPAGEPVTVAGVRAAAVPATVQAVNTVTPAAAPLRVRYAYTALSGSMATMWVANDLGLFAKYGIQPELQYVPSIQTIQAVLAGETDFGLMSGRTPIEARLAAATWRSWRCSRIG